MAAVVETATGILPAGGSLKAGAPGVGAITFFVISTVAGHQRKVGVMSKALASFVGLLALLLGPAVNAQTKADSDSKVTLLGTGTPVPDLDRFGPSTLVEAGNKKLLFDAGRGATIRLRQSNSSIVGIMSKIDALFLTHYHLDHTLGIPDLWLTG